MSQLVRLEGKHSTQNAHCALGRVIIMVMVIIMVIAVIMVITW